MAGANPALVKKIPAGGGNSSVARKTTGQSTMKDKLNEAKNRPVKSDSAAAAEKKAPPPKPAAEKKKPPYKRPDGKMDTGGGNSSVTRDTKPQGNWSEKAAEAKTRGQPVKKPPVAAGGGASGTAKSILRRLGPVGAAAGFIVDASEANKGEKEWLESGNRGPLMKGNGTRKAAGTYTKPYDKAEDAKSDLKKAAPPKPKAKPIEVKRDAMKAKKQGLNKGAKKFDSKNSAGAKGSRAAAKPGFKANWKNAAPTPMQARGGAKIDRGGGAIGAIKKARAKKSYF